MPISIDNILLDFVNPPQEGLIQRVKNKFKSVEERKSDLQVRMQTGQAIKDGLKTHFWREVQRPYIINELYSGMGKLLRPSSLTMSEVEIKSILSNLHSVLGIISHMRYIVDDGERAGKELSTLEAK